MARPKRVSALCVFLFLALFLGCGKGTDPDRTAGTVTETENALVSGLLYQEAGIPARGARVHFIRADYASYTLGLDKSLLSYDSAVTDSLGRYGTNNLSPGLYNIFGADAGNHLSLVDSFRVSGDTQRVVNDTLKDPGSLLGVVKLEGSDDPRNVLLVCFGSSRLALPSQKGDFLLARMAEGRYSVRFICYGYEPLDTSFTVLAGRELSLPDTVRLKFKGVPAPQAPTLFYDTLKQTVNLSWNRLNTTPAVGYLVYRRDAAIGGILKPLNSASIPDTLFQDTTAIQDQTYDYAIVAIDPQGTESAKSPLRSVTIHSAFKFIGQLGASGSGFGEYQNPVTVCIDSLGRILVADCNGGKVIAYDTAGSAIEEITGFTRPIGIVPGPQKSLYILEDTTLLIKRVDSTGKVLISFGGEGTGPEQFSFKTPPWKAALSSENQLYIPDLLNNQIKKFDLSGSFLGSIAVNHPWALEFMTSTLLAVGFSDNADYGIMLMDTLGNIQRKWKGFYLNLQRTPSGNILATSSSNGGWVSICSTTGELLARFGRTDQFINLSDARIISPYRLVTVDSEAKKVFLFSMPLL